MRRVTDHFHRVVSGCYGGSQSSENQFHLPVEKNGKDRLRIYEQARKHGELDYLRSVQAAEGLPPQAMPDSESDKYILGMT